jgi:hypothetical protein
MNNFCVYIGRPICRALFLFLVVLLSGSCALFSSEEVVPVLANSAIPKSIPSDFAYHLSHLDKSLFASGKVKELRLSRRNKEYLNSIYTRIASNNELLLPSKAKPSFFVIKDKVPFIFSLPGYKIFISRGMIKKYFRNESLLVSAICFEIIKSGRNIYRKSKVIPTGTIGIPQLLSLTRLSFENRIEIYKWTYFALRRAEYDASALLIWIQTLNKNTLDFSWQIRDPRGVSKEEFLFKNFLTKLGVTTQDVGEANSSRGFYRLKDSV